MITIRKGLNLPIAGAPQQQIDSAPLPSSVAVIGEDYIGMKPTMAVAEGDVVQRGQTLFSCKKTEGVVYTAPAAGKVRAINRGAKRALLSVVIDVVGNDAIDFGTVAPAEAKALDRENVIEKLRVSGQWSAFRTRPFSRVPALDSTPTAIFVTAMESAPLSADAAVIIADAADDFALGLDLVAKLTDGKTYVCSEAGTTVPSGSAANLASEQFAGPHPAGLAGTHIHFLEPVGAEKTVWTIGYQDVIAIGRLFATGQLSSERVVALGGPSVRKPRLLRTLAGACLTELTQGEVEEGDNRVVSGSVLSGRTAAAPVCYLGRYHTQVSVLPDEAPRELLGYLKPGSKQYSVFPAFLSRWFGAKDLRFTTNSNGSPRGMVPIGTFESVVPMDMLPTQLLRSLLVSDLETAVGLGALELDEEDVGLRTYVCPGKYEYGPVLRTVLDQIQKEG